MDTLKMLDVWAVMSPGSARSAHRAPAVEVPQLGGFIVPLSSLKEKERRKPPLQGKTVVGQSTSGLAESRWRYKVKLGKEVW